MDAALPLTDSERLRRISELQERAARAIPAAAEEHRDGCWLRMGDSTTTWWAGATLLHGAASASVEAGIATTESFYAAYGRPARFQVCPACPPDLDDALSRRGYEVEHVASLQTLTTRHAAGAPAAWLQLTLRDRPDPEWFEVWLAVQESHPDADAEWRLLQRVGQSSAYATVRLRGRPVSIGRAVADTGWTGIFNMATLPAARRQGTSTAVLTALTAWAATNGSPRMYLQVDQDNPAALGLYRSVGFEELCTYHYRVTTAAVA